MQKMQKKMQLTRENGGPRQKRPFKNVQYFSNAKNAKKCNHTAENAKCPKMQKNAKKCICIFIPPLDYVYRTSLFNDNNASLFLKEVQKDMYEEDRLYKEAMAKNVVALRKERRQARRYRQYKPY